MKIVIVGAGHVGEELCIELSQWGHDIILIDKNAERVEEIMDRVDIAGLVGNGANNDNLIEVGADNADIFISVTESDELNIMACVIAKKIGSKYTIARVRDPEYSRDVLFVKNQLGVNFMINPEMEASKSIVNQLKYPNALDVFNLFSHRATMLELKLLPNSKLEGVQLKNLDQTIQEHVIICFVKREDSFIIPSGDFIFEANDIIYLTGRSSSVSKFYEKLGYESNNIKSSLLIGGGIITHYLTKKLLDNKYRVKIIDYDTNKVETLSEEYPKAYVIKGKETDQDFLLKEGIQHYDSVIALTNNDEENIVISMFAKSVNENAKVITKMSRTMLLPILTNQGFSPIVPEQLISNIILRVVRSKIEVKSSKMSAIYRFSKSEVEAIVFEVEPESKAIQIPLKDLNIKKDILIATIVRNERVIYPSGIDVIKPNDKVMVIAYTGTVDELDDILE